MNDHDNSTHPTGGHDDGRTLEDVLVGALSGRSGQARPGAGSIRDVRLRARHRARRRMAVGGGMIVAVGALGVAFVGRNDDTGPRLVTGDGAGTPYGAGGSGSTGPWECTGLLGTSTGAGLVPAPSPTTTSPRYDGAITTTTVIGDGAITTTTVIGDGTVMTTLPHNDDLTTTSIIGGGTVTITSSLFDVVSSSLPVGDDAVSSTTVPAGVESTPWGTTVGPDITYTLQSCTLVGTVDPTLDSAAAAAAAAAKLATLQAQEAALRAKLAQQGIDTTIPFTDAPGTTVTATFDPGDTVPAFNDPGATVPAIRVDDTTAASG